MPRPDIFMLTRPELPGFPEIELPFYQRSLGHYFRRGNWSEYLPQHRDFVQLFWCADGEADVWIQEKKFRFRSGDFFYYLPGEVHRLCGVGGTCEYRWLTFDGPQAKEFIAGYGFPRCCFAAGRCPVELFAIQEQLLREHTPFAWREMVSVICRILAFAGGGRSGESSQKKLAERAKEICAGGFGDPGLNTASLAEKLGVSRTTLLRAFRQQMHTTPSEYLTALRLQSALSCLADRRRTLKESAALSGFADPAYFSRVIRKKYGCAPSELRKRLEAECFFTAP